MADGQIVSRAMIAQRGVKAYLTGQPRDSHNMNPWTEGAKTFVAAWDALAHSKLSLQNTAGVARRVDAAQECVL